MPANYTGNSTAVQAPDVAPEPLAGPICQLPSDGDSANAASIAQGFKVLADNVTWLKSPRAKSGSWTQPIVPVKNARGQTRTRFDHMGHLTGPFAIYHSDLGMSGTEGVETEGHPFHLQGMSGWYGRRLGAWALLQANYAGNTPAYRRGNGVSLYGGTATDDYSVLFKRAPFCTTAANISFSYEFSAALFNAASTSEADVRLGLCKSEFVSPVSEGGIWIRKTGAETTWHLVSATSGGGASVTDTGVPADATYHEWRFEFYGADAADDSIAKVLFYCDGALVHTETTTVPDATVQIAPHNSVKRIGSANQFIGAVFGGPVRFVHSWA